MLFISLCRASHVRLQNMDNPNSTRSPFENLYGELCDSLNRFDAMMQQSPFGTGLWWRPSAWLPTRPMDAIEAQQHQIQGQYPAPQQGCSRNELAPWSGSLMHWPHGSAGWFQHNSCIPRIDLSDAGDKLVLHADMPGLDKNDVKVEAHDGRISIQAQRKNEREQTGGNWFMQERCSSSFYRSFTLPPGTKQEGIKATYNNGVLEVNIPKAAAPSTPPSRTINID